MMTINKMAQTLAVLAYESNNDALRAIVDRFLDADDEYIENKTPGNLVAARSAYFALRSAWVIHFS